MKIAFLTEMNFEGKIPSNHPNMRTEFAWMYDLNADHYPFEFFTKVSNYDHVFTILPKGKLNLSAEGTKIGNQINPASTLLNSNVIEGLKKQNNKVHYMQEGPSWWFNDYEIIDQFNFYNSLAECDSIFALLIEDLIKNIEPKPEEKVIIGGNFARWYGGFQSYMVADEFNVDKWTQESHAKRENESDIHDLNHLPRISWLEWMNTLSTFKYAIHLMPTIAAGTFSLNCAYFGIPCKQLKEDKEWYRHCSKMAKFNYSQFYDIEIYKTHLNNIL